MVIVLLITKLINNLEINGETEYIHVKEGLQPSIKTCVCDLFPEFMQLIFSNC